MPKAGSRVAFIKRLFSQDSPVANWRNKAGGIDPQNPHDMERAKAADLITLPPEVPGTNCGNCMYFGKTSDSRNFARCQNPKLTGIPVNKRMCCALWDRRDVNRPWIHQEKK